MAEVKKAVKATLKAKSNAVLGTGRRKKAIARVRIIPGGNGTITINKQHIDDYFKQEILKKIVAQPLALTGTDKKYDIHVNVVGGGFAGQAGAICNGIARALVKAEANLHTEIKKAGFLTRDSRMKERKKYGLKKARKAPQFSKR